MTKDRDQDVKAVSRRPVGFWSPFNDWWRSQLKVHGRRPRAAEIASWYERYSEREWGRNKPSFKETRIHAKCLRSTEEVREYFRRYRATKKEDVDEKPVSVKRRAAARETRCDSWLDDMTDDCFGSIHGSDGYDRGADVNRTVFFEDDRALRTRFSTVDNIHECSNSEGFTRTHIEPGVGIKYEANPCSTYFGMDTCPTGQYQGQSGCASYQNGYQYFDSSRNCPNPMYGDCEGSMLETTATYQGRMHGQRYVYAPAVEPRAFTDACSQAVGYDDFPPVLATDMREMWDMGGNNIPWPCTLLSEPLGDSVDCGVPFDMESDCIVNVTIKRESLGNCEARRASSSDDSLQSEGGYLVPSCKSSCFEPVTESHLCYVTTASVPSARTSYISGDLEEDSDLLCLGNSDCFHLQDLNASGDLHLYTKGSCASPSEDLF